VGALAQIFAGTQRTITQVTSMSGFLSMGNYSALGTLPTTTYNHRAEDHVAVGIELIIDLLQDIVTGDAAGVRPAGAAGAVGAVRFGLSASPGRQWSCCRPCRWQPGRR
jgi:hypothetical protein